MKPTLCETVTAQIVAAIEAGAETYHMPWHRSRRDVASPANAITSRSYRGVNVLSLWTVAEARGFASGQWATYRQWQEAGAQVRKGAKAATVVFWQRADTAEDVDLVCRAEQRAPVIARAYSVFNADQVDGWMAPALPILPESERIAAAEAFIAAIPATISHGGNSAYYVPAADRVQVPAFGQFKRPTDYYATLAHELTHWTGAKPRLDRDLSGRFGSEAYAMEELVAELGAAFVTAQLGLPSVPLTDHAPYLASWLKVLKADSRAIFTAAGRAQAAVDYLVAFDDQ